MQKLFNSKRPWTILAERQTTVAMFMNDLSLVGCFIGWLISDLAAFKKIRCQNSDMHSNECQNSDQSESDRRV